MKNYLPSEPFLDFGKTHCDVWKLFNMSFWILGSIKKSFGFFLQCFDFVFEDSDLIFQITFIEFVDIDYVMIAVLPNSTSEAYSTWTVLTESFKLFILMITAPKCISSIALKIYRLWIGDNLSNWLCWSTSSCWAAQTTTIHFVCWFL